LNINEVFLLNPAFEVVLLNVATIVILSKSTAHIDRFARLNEYIPLAAEDPLTPTTSVRFEPPLMSVRTIIAPSAGAPL